MNGEHELPRPLFRGRAWLRLLMVLAVLRLFVAARWALVTFRIPAELLTECGDHDGPMRWAIDPPGERPWSTPKPDPEQTARFHR